MYACFHCKTPWESSLRQPAVKETCEACGAYLHCCKNCRFHRTGYPNECYIPDTEKIADKTRANFCDEFEFRKINEAAPAPDPTQDALAQLLGEKPSDERTGSDQAAPIEEWFAAPDKPKEDFGDLFEE